jgi:cell wall-associated NlpC family hydrolase
VSIETTLAGASSAISAISAIQSRIAEVHSRFRVAPGGVSFDTALGLASGSSGPSGGVRRAASISSAGTGGDLGSTDATGSDVVDVAQRYLGVPYVWGGDDPAGFDCSGFVQYVFAQVGLDLPRVSSDQARVGQPVASLAEARPGDLVAFNSPVDHIGIYAGNGMMVVAPHRGDVVKLQAVYEQPTAIRRVLPDAPAPATTRSGAAALLGGLVSAQRTGLLGNLGSPADSLVSTLLQGVN